MWRPNTTEVISSIMTKGEMAIDISDEFMTFSHSARNQKSAKNEPKTSQNLDFIFCIIMLV